MHLAHNCTALHCASLHHTTTHNFRSQTNNLSQLPWSTEHQEEGAVYAQLFFFVFTNCVDVFSFSLLYLTGISGSVYVLAGGQQQEQCVNPGHPRVALKHSSIHYCLVFLLDSLLLSPPDLSNFYFYLTQFSLKSSPSSAWIFSFPLPSQASSEDKNRLETAATCCSQSYLQCRSSHSKLFCSGLLLIPCSSLPLLLSGKCSLIFSFSTHSLALPLTLIVV